ncbi:MAG TPA: MBOAT family O-acyltransferase [Polyangiaceae bacterium]|nr:MBOAT family O-acyltransferase [Polyangiaceae bacterium]
MSLTSTSFLVLALAAILLSRALPAAARPWVLSAASVVFIGSYLDRPIEALPLAGLLVGGYWVVEALRRTRSALLLTVALATVVGSFLVLKRYGFVPAFARVPLPYLVVGLSYVLFRLLHLMIDARQGELGRRIPVQQFFNYCAGFLTFTAGPIQLYPDFVEQQARGPSNDPAEVADAMQRVVRGFVLVCVVSAVLNYVFAALSVRLLQATPQVAGPLVFAVCAALYTAYLYANFAGYMHIVIGVGALMGLRLPENFAQPFAARSFLEFWSRWHMTLSGWFKTYLFNPLLKRLTQRWPSAGSAPYLAVLAFFITFLVMGIWHGSTLVFVVYGLFLGAGASLNKLWQDAARARWGKREYKRLSDQPLAIYASRGLVFGYFALALTCLWVSLPQLLALAGSLGFVGVVGAFLALSASAAVGFAVWDKARAVAGRWRLPHASTRSGWGAELAMAAQVLLVLGVGSFFHKAPEFVYRAF